MNTFDRRCRAIIGEFAGEFDAGRFSSIPDWKPRSRAAELLFTRAMRTKALASAQYCARDMAGAAYASARNAAYSSGRFAAFAAAALAKA